MVKNKKRPEPAKGIISVLPRRRSLVQFSFLHYDLERTEYCFSLGEIHDIRRSLEVFKDYNGKTWIELLRDRSTLHLHEVDWSATKEPKGFQNQAIEEAAAFQFALIGVNNQKARVFGIFEDPVFYIVWIDWNHQIQPSKKKNT